jgi:hypothetical protein
MKMMFTDEEQAFINAFNYKIAIWRTLKDLAEVNLLNTTGVAFKSELEKYLLANQDKWVELQQANNN